MKLDPSSLHPDLTLLVLDRFGSWSARQVCPVSNTTRHICCSLFTDLLDHDSLPGDLSSKDGIAKVVSDFSRAESKLHILVNAAGVLHVDPIKSHPDDIENLAKSLWSAEEDGWKNSFDVNVLALYFTSVGFLPYMRAAFEAEPSTEDSPRETPVVINIGSIAGLHNARDAASVSYQTSKSAVSHLTTCLATRFLPMRVRCNALMPGLFPTEMTTTDPKEIRNTHKTHFKAMPEGRAGAPEDIVGPCIFLASRAGAYVNGNIMDVSGGRTLLLSGSIIP